MLSQDWQDLFGEFREGYATYAPLCFRLVMTRFVPGERGGAQLPAGLAGGLYVSAGCLSAVEPSGQRVFLTFTVTGRPGPAKGLLVTADGKGGVRKETFDLEPDPTQPLDDGSKAASEFLRLARKGGALLSGRHLAEMGVVSENQPEALWAFFILRTLAESPGGFIFERGEGKSHVTVVRNPFGASVRAIELAHSVLADAEAIPERHSDFRSAVEDVTLGILAGAQAAQEDGKAEPAENRQLPRRVAKVWDDFQDAIVKGKFSDSPPKDREVYGWLLIHRRRGEDLPKFTTWQRYLREARKSHGYQKNTPRGGRATGSSIDTETGAKPINTLARERRIKRSINQTD
ncbi:hypothetical protein LCGC14_1349010 [marine sediment metagenome]|uniref:Uncharacterized protein n=1 Tax=marine sediment metagenome TaxID=412755 RepID=A0A0F9NDQ5_9ZZZZ